jgi:hypothetical protein
VITTRLLLAILLMPVFASSAQILSPRGYGVIAFGEQLKDAEARVQEVVSSTIQEPGCDFVRFKKYPGIKFMVEDGVIMRADAAGTIRNSSGVKVGMRLAEVKRRYPGVKVEPHKYDDHGHYLSLPTSDGKAALLFEESLGRVTYVRAGLYPSVEYVEGCL